MLASIKARPHKTAAALLLAAAGAAVNRNKQIVFSKNWFCIKLKEAQTGGRLYAALTASSGRQ